MTFLTRAAFLLYAVAVLVAIWVQDHSGALSLGLFNENRAEYQGLSAASLVLFAAIAAVFVAEMLRRKPVPLAGALRGLIASFLLLELLLFAADVALVSRGSSFRLGGPYWEFQSASGDWVWGWGAVGSFAGPGAGVRRGLAPLVWEAEPRTGTWLLPLGRAARMSSASG